MRLLFLTPQLPYPPRQGAALRNWGFLRELARAHEVHLLCFGEPDSPVPPGLASLAVVPPPRRSLARRLLELVTTAEPDMARRLASAPFAAALARLLARHPFDAVQVEAIELAPFALPHLGRGDGPLWLYDAHNAESDLQRSAMLADWRQPRRWHAAAYSTLQTWKLARFERRLLARFDRVLAVSDEDARRLASLGGVQPLVIPNGIDTEATAPGIPPAPALRDRSSPALVFTGKMDFRPNVDGLLWFVEEILPRIELEGPPPTLWAVGQGAHPSLERLRGHPQVVLTGWVDAVEPFLAGADVVVAPLRMGSGTRLKVLQALSMARPLVGTSLGGAGLGLRDGEHLCLADEPAAFARAIGALLRDPARAAAMGQRAREHVRAHFDWRVLAPRLEQALLRLKAQKGQAA